MMKKMIICMTLIMMLTGCGNNTTPEHEITEGKTIITEKVQKGSVLEVTFECE